MLNQMKILFAAALLAHADRLAAQLTANGVQFTPNPAANQMVIDDPFAFLVAVVVIDQAPVQHPDDRNRKRVERDPRVERLRVGGRSDAQGPATPRPRRRRAGAAAAGDAGQHRHLSKGRGNGVRFGLSGTPSAAAMQKARGLIRIVDPAAAIPRSSRRRSNASWSALWDERQSGSCCKATS